MLGLWNILFLLFREAQLEVSAFKIQHFLFLNCRLGSALVAVLCFILRVEMGLVIAQVNIGHIGSAFAVVGANGLDIVDCSIGGDKVVLVIS